MGRKWRFISYIVQLMPGYVILINVRETHFAWILSARIRVPKKNFRKALHKALTDAVKIIYKKII